MNTVEILNLRNVNRGKFSEFTVCSVVFQELDQPGAPRILELEEMSEGKLTMGFLLNLNLSFSCEDLQKF